MKTPGTVWDSAIYVSGLASVAGVESSAFSIGEELSAIINHTKATATGGVANIVMHCSEARPV